MKRFEYKNLFMASLETLNGLGVEGWEMCGNMGSNIILKREKEKTYFQEIFDDEEAMYGLRFYDWENGQLDELVNKIHFSKFSYIILCGEFKESYDYVEEIHVYNEEINLDEAREGFSKFDGIKVWKFDYDKKTLEEIKDKRWNKSPFYKMLVETENALIEMCWDTGVLENVIKEIDDNNEGLIKFTLNEDGIVTSANMLIDNDETRKELREELGNNNSLRGCYFNIGKKICARLISFA